MNIVALEDSPGNVGQVRRARLQLLYRRLFVVESFEKLIWKFGPVKRLAYQFGYGFFNFNGIHIWA